MAEYISREAARKLICGFCLECDGSTDVCEYRDIQIDRIPAADVRPVVLCKDCKYWFNAPAADGFNSCEQDALIRHENFFCAAGEKREG